jgi:hypothetical protein
LADKWTGEDGGLKELKRWGVEVIRTFWNYKDDIFTYDIFCLCA